MLYISLRQYEYVCAVGRHGSLSAAAQHLNVSQPALSTALTRVEEHLGVPTVHSPPGCGHGPDPAGSYGLLRQAEVFAERRCANRNLRITSAPGNPPRNSHWAASQTSPRSYWPLPCIILRVAFTKCQRFPTCRASFEGLLNGLIDGQIDIAITYDLTMDAGFTRTKLFDSRPKALMPLDHPLGVNHMALPLHRHRSAPV